MNRVQEVNYNKQYKYTIVELADNGEACDILGAATRKDTAELFAKAEDLQKLNTDMLAMLKGILESYEADMPFCYIDCDKIKSLIARHVL